MRKILLFIVSLFTLSALNAQGIQLLDKSGNVVNGDTIEFIHYMDTAIAQSDFKHDQFVTVFNSSTTDSMNIDLSREEIDIIPGTADYYCWGTQCLLATNAGINPFWQANDPVKTAPQDSAGGLAPLSIYISPRGNDGEALFKFIFTDIDDRTGNTEAIVYVRWTILDSTVYSDPVMLFNPKPRKFVVFGDSISRKTSINGDTIKITSGANRNTPTATFEQELNFNVFNATGQMMQLDMSREEISTIQGSGDYFSWNNDTTAETSAGTVARASANSAVQVMPRKVANSDFSMRLFLKSDSIGTAIYKYTYTDMVNTNNKGSFFVKWVVDDITSLDELEYENSFSVYPNPVNDFTRINFEKPLTFNQQEIEVYNILGEEIQSVKVAFGARFVDLNASELPSGIYFLNVIVDGSKIGSKKMIVQ